MDERMELGNLRGLSCDVLHDRKIHLSLTGQRVKPYTSQSTELSVPYSSLKCILSLGKSWSLPKWEWSSLDKTLASTSWVPCQPQGRTGRQLPGSQGCDFSHSLACSIIPIFLVNSNFPITCSLNFSLRPWVKHSFLYALTELFT